jgi:RNA polymerase sigma-B factor
MLVDAPHRGADPDALILAHQPLAKRLACRYARGDRSMLEDLEQVAAVGLVQAAHRYDPAHGAAFTTFAVPTILGELRRHFRTTRWAAHVPRRLQESYLVAREAELELSAATGRSASTDELAERLGWTPERVLEARAARSALAPVSLDAPVQDDGLASPLGERLGSEDAGYLRAELRDELEQALAALEPPADEAVRLRYEDELPMREVAARIGVSPSHASKLVGSALRTLQGLLEPGRRAAPSSG